MGLIKAAQAAAGTVLAGGAIDIQRRTRPTLRHTPIHLNRLHQLPLPGRLQSFRRTTSCSISLSRLSSATSFFSRAFSSSSAFSRFCPGQIVDISISGARMAQYLDDLALLNGLPEEIVLDNNPEGTSRAMFDWSGGLA